MKKRIIGYALLAVFFAVGCTSPEQEGRAPVTATPTPATWVVTATPTTGPTVSSKPTPTKTVASFGSPSNDKKEEDNTSMEGNSIAEIFTKMEYAKGYKGYSDNNPIYVQTYGADPYAISYKGRVYFYMTADNEDYDKNGELKENGYGQIKTIRVVSTADFVNYEDHGAIKAAGTICKWANNSWAPAACWKTIDGVDKFFVYFADSGNGIGVMVADSPTGPFTDPLGHALINRQTPNCNNVYWLFDPAVLVDEDGTGYLYFGGGVPSKDVAANPGTGRCVQLTDDMTGIVGTPVSMDIPYLFEDSGIHKYNGKYYYSYCSNWNVDAEGTAKYGFGSGEIAVMESDNPLGPFVYKERVLKNPGSVFGLYGNNHHCIFSHEGKWYITYHARTLEKAKGIEKGYRSTHVNAFEPAEDGTIGEIKMSKKGVEALGNVNAYEENAAACGAILAGVKTVGADEVSRKAGVGKMAVSAIDSGDWIFIRNVDFGEQAPSKLVLKISRTGDINPTSGIKLAVGKPQNEAVAYFDLAVAFKGVEEGRFAEYEFILENPEALTGVQNISIAFSGTGYSVLSWQFK